jgi:AmiR/NasT family two-component response regulator
LREGHHPTAILVVELEIHGPQAVGQRQRRHVVEDRVLKMGARDPAFVKEASKRGVFAHIFDTGVDDWQSSIDIVLRRFTEYSDLQGAFGRRALIERAKGILMERHSIDENAAFEMLREHSRADNRKLIDLATAVVDGHRLLPSNPGASAES